MKKQVPFKKEINFDDNIAQINSISLEQEVAEKTNGLISGKFIITGDYKITESSINLDKFEYELPYNINIDKKYDIENVSVEISDFYYEVVNNKILSVNIELTLDNIEEVLLERVEELVEEKVEKTAETIDNQSERCIEEEITTSLFGNLEDNDNYVTYKIHIVTDNDTIESIIEDYGTTREQLEGYNDLVDVKLGDKIIIPFNAD